MSEPAPVRVKLYGFVPMTRRRYVFQLVVAVGLALAVLAAWWLRWRTLRDELQVVRTPNMARLVAVMDVIPWVILSVGALQALEAWYVFGLFAKKEKEAATATTTAAATPGPEGPGYEPKPPEGG